MIVLAAVLLVAVVIGGGQTLAAAVAALIAYSIYGDWHDRRLQRAAAKQKEILAAAARTREIRSLDLREADRRGMAS